MSMSQALFLQLVQIGIVQSQWQAYQEVYYENPYTNVRQYYSPELTSEYNPSYNYYKEAYYQSSFGTDVFWKSYDQNRNVFSESLYKARYDQEKLYSNQGNKTKSTKETEFIIAIVCSSFLLLLISVCLCRAYTVAKRLVKTQKNLLIQQNQLNYVTENDESNIQQQHRKQRSQQSISQLENSGDV